jgi:O-antigen/teichoic acid export membrane protein
MRKRAGALVGYAERIVRTDLRYVLSGGFFLSLTQVSSAIIGLILTTAFANLLPVETYGTYRYILAMYTMFAIAAMPGLDTAVIQSVSRGYDRAYLDGVRTRMRWALLGTAAAIAYGGYLVAQQSTVMGYLFIMLGIALPLMESGSMYTTYLNAKREYRTWAIMDIIGQVCSAAVLILTMYLTKNIFVLMIGYFLPYITIRWGATWWVVRHHNMEGEHDPDFFAYGRSLTLFQVATRAISSLDQIVLYHFLGPAQVAMFSLATAIPTRLQGLFRITGTLAFPKFATQHRQDILRGLPVRMALFGAGIVLLCLLYILVAPYLFKILFPKYLPSLFFSQVAIFYTLSAVTYPFGAFLNAHKRLRENYMLSIAAFIVKATCLLVFVPRLGIWGAVIGLLATSATTIVIASWYLYSMRNDASVSVPGDAVE